MNRLVTLIAVLLTTALFTVQGASEAKAQFWFVSHSGSDSNNNCYTATTACSTIAGALAKASDGNVIVCVDAGFFGYPTITKSITIDCTAGGGTANVEYVIINAPSKTVTLRNLGFGPVGPSPIEIQAASGVYIENVFVTGRSGQSSAGLYDHRAGPGTLTIFNSSFVFNPGAGIVVVPASGTILVSLENVRSAYNKYGFAVGIGGRVTIKNSLFMNNSVSGIEGDPGSFIEVDSSKMSFNQTGIQSNGSTTLSRSQIISNSTAISGATQSTGDNLIVGNSADGTAPIIISRR